MLRMTTTRWHLDRRSVLTGLALLPLLGACAHEGGDGGRGDRRPETPDPTASGASGESSSMSTVSYGPHRSQSADLHLPAGSADRLPVVVVIHGGYWTKPYDRQLGHPLALDLVKARVAALNIDYRRIDEGGYPATLLDVAAAIDAIPTLHHRLDPSRVVALGHSAGGQLAVWAASRAALPHGSPGARPRVTLDGAVSQAGVLDLVEAAKQQLGSGAVARLLGGSAQDVPDRYGVASPWALVPCPAPVVAVHGTADNVVPLAQSRGYVEHDRLAGGAARLVELAGVDHFAMIDVASDAWAVCRREVLAMVGVAG